MHRKGVYSLPVRESWWLSPPTRKAAGRSRFSLSSSDFSEIFSFKHTDRTGRLHLARRAHFPETAGWHHDVDFTSESASRTLINACRVTPSRRAS